MLSNNYIQDKESTNVVSFRDSTTINEDCILLHDIKFQVTIDSFIKDSFYKHILYFPKSRQLTFVSEFSSNVLLASIT